MPASGHQSIIRESFSSDVYSLEVVKKAAYRFLDRASFDFDINDGRVECAIVLISSEEDDTETFLNDFRNEILDQDLRQSIAEETQDIRNAILGFALSRTGLQED
jgi:His-Xaa-Ser system protein HxsD